MTTRLLSHKFDYFLIGRDCWIEILSYLSFNERCHLRVVCKRWNKWILEANNLWPISNISFI